MDSLLAVGSGHQVGGRDQESPRQGNALNKQLTYLPRVRGRRRSWGWTTWLNVIPYQRYSIVGQGVMVSGNFVLLHFIYCTSSSSSSSHHRPSPSSSSSSSSTITIINHHLPHHPTNPNPDISLSSTTIIFKSLFLHSITSGSDDLLLSSLDLDDLNHLDLVRSDLHLALTIWICVHLHSRWSGLVLVLRGGGFGFGDCGGGGGGGGLKGCLGFLGFLG
ncbi:hypothetical protein LWI29_030034 [Acer saccharum]|uniref:Uncharacterized protein n=1 Tax=Acer saccharum TaxID=4024 RepID=A0AA39W4E9_ACESA|nr:hypothetical protein LWI29_030034 [Acer saccharum]